MPRTAIRMTASVLRQLIDHTRQNPQVECCGFLAGRDGIITLAFPAENIAASPATTYEVATTQIVHLRREIRAAGLEMSGIYHSHPNGKGEPSQTDIATVGYPDVAYFIISPTADAGTVRAFLIRDRQITELKLLIV